MVYQITVQYEDRGRLSQVMSKDRRSSGGAPYQHLPHLPPTPHHTTFCYVAALSSVRMIIPKTNIMMKGPWQLNHHPSENVSNEMFVFKSNLFIAAQPSRYIQISPTTPRYIYHCTLYKTRWHVPDAPLLVSMTNNKMDSGQLGWNCIVVRSLSSDRPIKGQTTDITIAQMSSNGRQCSFICPSSKIPFQIQCIIYWHDDTRHYLL